ncbi:MAG TPA: PQQ-binding-like beta-propeller repeat protein [Candidatus Hydrogenedentes bacterium]|nr:PQQ-binding-like beta-propeller repeat protein [Candidatus Hydrogenedentota bacterium]HRT22098.1 PQQ-binding-like beta-propeller repeat protein [Candidatus Hydrogenedentota bacterium]HRT66968.1 PQQ-binding-like beta-propeller repeat protein [Candidatus Hydrogenedentota bacterium]
MHKWVWIGLVSLAMTRMAHAGSESIEWTVALDGPAFSPTLYPNETAPSGVVVSSGKTVQLIRGDGTVAWRADMPDPAATPATVADLDEDGSFEAIAALADGTVICLDATGTTRWAHAFDTPAGGFKVIVASDLTPSRGLEILAGFDDGWLNCLSADGRLLWRFFGDRSRVGGIAIGCTDGDNVPEILHGTDNGHVYCLDNFGHVQWRYTEQAPYGRSGPNLAITQPGGAPGVFITRSNVGNATCLMALDAPDGAFLWRTSDAMQGYFSNAFADFDGDGSLEILHADKGNNLYCENADGTRRWQAELGGHGIFWAPAVADIDGDGALEVIVGVRGTDPKTGACAYVVGADGTVKSSLKLGGGSNAAPAVGDIDGDGELEAIFAVENPNQLLAMTWRGKGRVAWPSLRGNSRMTANANVPQGGASEPGVGSAPHALASLRPIGNMTVDMGEGVWGDNTWTISWKDPAQEGAFLETAVYYAGHADESRIIDVKSGATQAVVRVRLYRPEPAQVVLHLHTTDSAEPALSALREIAPNPPAFCRIETVQQVCDRALAAGANSNADTEGIETGLALLRAAVKTIESLDPGRTPAASLIQRATALRNRADALESQARMLEGFWRQNGSGSFVWWKDENPWDAFDPLETPAVLDMTMPVVVQAFQDEREDVALTLRNISAAPLDVRCTFTDPATKGMRHVEPELSKKVVLRHAVPVATALQDRVFDALPKLDSSRTIQLPPGESRQLWIVVDTHDLEPGTHELTLYLGSLDKPTTLRAVPLRIEVWPIRLPGDVFAKMNWCGFNEPETSNDAARDLIEHGVSAAYGPPLPSIPVDAEGRRAGDVDWTAFDRAMARIPRHFTLFWGGPPACKWPEGAVPKEDSDVHFNGFKTSVEELARHLESLGFTYRQWAFYPIDEPWNTGFTLVPILKRFCEMVKRADPNVQMYADPAGLVRVEYLDEFKNLVDIWQPEMNLLKRDPKLVEWFQKNAKRFWTYEAPGPAKDLPPLGHYRAFAWMAWKFGCEGAGYWVYRGEDNWWTFTNPDYSVVYETNRQITPSRRWEADRDGVEDYRALHVLREAIAKARAIGHAAEAQKAQALMDEAVEQLIGWQMANIDEITRWTKDYSLDFDLLMDYRARIAAAIMDLEQQQGHVP